MAHKGGNGSGNGSGVQGEMLDVLKAIRESAETTRAELRGLREDTNARFRETNSRLEALGSRVEVGFAKVDARLEHVEERLDNIRDFAGEHYRSLEARVTRLEARGTEPR